MCVFLYTTTVLTLTCTGQLSSYIAPAAVAASQLSKELLLPRDQVHSPTGGTPMGVAARGLPADWVVVL